MINPLFGGLFSMVSFFAVLFGVYIIDNAIVDIDYFVGVVTIAIGLGSFMAVMYESGWFPYHKRIDRWLDS